MYARKVVASTSFSSQSALTDYYQTVNSVGSVSSISKPTVSNHEFFCEAINNRAAKHSDSCEFFSVDNEFVEEPWLCQPSQFSHNFVDSDSSDILGSENFSQPIDPYSDGEVTASASNESFISYRTVHQEGHPVEEPWLVHSFAKSLSSNVKIVDVSTSEQSVKDTESSPESQDKHQPTPEKLLPHDENIMMSDEGIVATKILINSSICTMQRIAVLENEKLVELLLEPVKNNVQCDSVYLGVVTKLVPHMGGAFVNIGGPRRSLMAIRPNREPFVFHPFRNGTKAKDGNGSVFSKLGATPNVSSDDAISDEIEETDDVLNDEMDDDLEEYLEDDLGEHENGDNYDIAQVLKENYNGSVAGHEIVDDYERYSEQSTGNSSETQGPTDDDHVEDGIIACGGDRKWEHVQKGTKILVQVVKEGLGTKGPTLTAYPKLRSRFWVLMSRCSTIGISRKISGVERNRLRVMAKRLQPPGFGLTLRTVAAGHSLEELQKDLEGLLFTWKSILEHAKSAALAADEGIDGAIPVMLNRAMGQTLSVVQDYFNEKVESMIVDSPRTYHEVTNYLQEIAPDLCDRVELYCKSTPLFDEYKIEEEIDNILSKRVPLANGGYLVIEQTEALVSIDVNGGHCMLGQGTSQEKAILDVNLTAAKQIARELRLRDIGGIIVVDFIDMLDDSNKRLVYEEVKRAVERDRSMVKVSELSRHGLMEIIRKRVRPSVTFLITEPCTCCHGTGRVEALETSFSKIERELCRLLSMMDQKPDPENPNSWPRFILRVDRYMCNYLTSGKRTKLAVLSSSLKVWILLKVARGFTRGSFELKPLVDDDERKQHHQATIHMLRNTATDVGTYDPTRKVTLFPIKKWKTGQN